MGQNEEMAWIEQLYYWEEKRKILEIEKEYWTLKLQMLKTKDYAARNEADMEQIVWQTEDPVNGSLTLKDHRRVRPAQYVKENWLQIMKRYVHSHGTTG